MIKVVIFDIGGVTVKHPMLHVCKSLEKKFKINWKRIKETDERFDPVIETNKISTKKFWILFARKLKIENVRALEKEWVKAFKEAAVLNEKVVRIIKDAKLRGYTVATISNTMNFHEKLHREKGHYKFFDKVFLSNRLRMRKPDAKIYRYVAEKLGVRLSECIFIDDKKINIIGARKTGMNAILFKDADQLKKDLKKYL